MQDISCLGGYLSAHPISLVDTSVTISAVLGDIWMNKIHTEMKVISLMGSDDHLSSHPSKMINWHMLEKTLLFNYEELRT